MNKVKLKDICNIKGRIGWKGYTTEDLCNSGPYVFGANEITSDNKISLKDVKHITREKYEESPEIMIHENDILVVKVGNTIGKVAILDEDYGEVTINPNCVSLQNIKVNPYYLYYFLCTKYAKSFLVNHATASAQPALSQNDLKELIVVIAKDELKIANVLKNIDKKIKLNNKINEELEKIAKTLYDYWFVQFDFPDENNRPYKSSGGAMVYNEELKREIPKGWEVKSLYEIAEYTNGLACQNYRPVNGEFYNVIKIKEMHEGFSCDTEHVRTDVPKKYIVENGDILFSWSATLEIQQWIGGKGVLNQHIFKVTSNHYPKSFYYFEIKNYINVFKRIAETRKTTMGHITIDHLKQAKIIIPPSHLIKKLDTKITPVFYLSTKLKEENQRLMRIRDFLLPMLMNGQVKVI